MIRAFLLAVMLWAAAGVDRAAWAEEAVDLELVLAVDVSGSIDSSEAVLQREGYVAALSSEEVLGAITAGPLGRIALAYVEWAGLGTARTVVDWRLIDGRAAAAAFIVELEDTWPRTGRRTSISGVIEYALPMFEGNGFVGARRIIDVSGDGPNNNGTPVMIARAQAAGLGVGVNGLVILNNEPGPLGFPVLEDLDIYFEECVITGPGAFVLAADGFVDFGRAIRRKLVLEIAGVSPTGPDRRAAVLTGGRWRLEPDAPRERRSRAMRPVQGYDCLIGERQLREWLRDNPFDP